MRPRERYAQLGPESFGDAELLALVLGTGVGGRPAAAIARDLLATFQTPAGLAAAPVQALTRISGVGPARAIRVHAACSLARRAGQPPADSLTCPEEVWRYLQGPLAGLDHEELHAVFLDRRQRVLARQRISSGNAQFTIVDPRQVLRPAVTLNAAALIVAHNHPSGDPEPSPEDLEVTTRLDKASRLLGVRLLDHVVFGRGRFVSLAERGHLGPWRDTPSTT